MMNRYRILLGLVMVAALLLTVSPVAAASYGEASGSGDFYADATGVANPGGRAHFTFVAKVKENKGPIGQLEFRYPLDDLKIKSTTFNYVTFNGAEVIFAGLCIKNNDESCTFEVAASENHFRLAILDEAGFPISIYSGYLAGGKVVITPP